MPWIIEERYHKLVAAFKARDPEQIVIQSAVLSHFVGDSHVPFHATKFYDGQTAEEKGIHSRWESNMLELCLKPESIRPSAPAKVDDILKSAFSWCIDSLSYVDEIAGPTTRPVREIRDVIHLLQMLYAQTGAVQRQRLTSAAEDLAGVYVAKRGKRGRATATQKSAGGNLLGTIRGRVNVLRVTRCASNPHSD